MQFNQDLYLTIPPFKSFFSPTTFSPPFTSCILTGLTQRPVSPWRLFPLRCLADHLFYSPPPPSLKDIVRFFFRVLVPGLRRPPHKRSYLNPPSQPDISATCSAHLSTLDPLASIGGIDSTLPPLAPLSFFDRLGFRQSKRGFWQVGSGPDPSFSAVLVILSSIAVVLLVSCPLW